MTEENTQQETQADRFVWEEGDVQISEIPETQVEMEQDDEPEATKAVHHATVEGANLAVARKEISADSCRAVIFRAITLQQAKAYGRDLDRHGNPIKSETPKKVTKKSTEPAPTPSPYSPEHVACNAVTRLISVSTGTQNPYPRAPGV